VTATITAPTAPGREVTPSAAADEIWDLIEHGLAHQPRSLQKRIGPSELGADCIHCLAAKLAGWEKTQDRAWLPAIGTGMHLLLEELFTSFEAENTSGAPRFLMEQRVTVGDIGGTPITGSTDLVDLYAGMTVDWKLVGPSSLRKYKTGPSATYRAQAHLYAKGWRAAGHDISTVAICFLPRNSPNMRDGFWWHEPYDEQLALDVLARANDLHATLTALAAVGTETRDAWISQLPRASDCWDCARFPDYERKTPTKTSSLLDGLATA